MLKALAELAPWAFHRDDPGLDIEIDVIRDVDEARGQQSLHGSRMVRLMRALAVNGRQRATNSGLIGPFSDWSKLGFISRSRIFYRVRGQ